MTQDNFDPTAYLRKLLNEDELEVNSQVEDVKGSYVESDRHDTFLNFLRLVVQNAARRRDPGKPHAANNRRPGMGLLLTAPSGAGKTTLIDNALKDNPAFPNYGSATEWCPLISVGAPSPCTLLQLAMRILMALGWHSTRELRENGAWLRVRMQLKEQKILFLVIDDFQHVLHQANEFEIQKVRDTLKDLMTSRDWPVQIILAGMPELVPFAKTDTQLRRRLKFMQLEPISPKRDFKFLDSAIKHYAKKCGLKLVVSAGESLVGRLCHAAQHQMGVTIEILTEAVEVALLRGEKTLTMYDFVDAYAARNLQPDDQNPFYANAWDTIDTSLVRPKSEDPTAEDAEDASATKRSTKPRRRRRTR
jgi:hypothetical protein